MKTFPLYSPAANGSGSGKKKHSGKAVSNILVIDDEHEMLNNYQRLLKRAGHHVHVSDDPAKLEGLLKEVKPDLVITDLMMPNGSGMQVLEGTHEYDPRLPVILVTAYGSIENAVEAMKHHAADYLTKPFSMNELLDKIQQALSRRLIEESEPATAAVPRETPETEGAKPGRNGIIGVSPAMEHVLELVRKVARTDVNVLVTGESGTGKELFARAIHHQSSRRNEIFVPVDCASLPENLLESELFGYTKGAFTGAMSDKKGLFEFAHKGTLFLDEIGEMPISLQSKLLRVLQERCFRRIGGREQIEVDVRVVAATNRDLTQEIREKNFRSDLYYRLNVITLHLPAMRERREDIPLLANHFLREFIADNRLPQIQITPNAMECLRRYEWPGNVRELQNVIEHAATLSGGEEIRIPDLPAEVHCLVDNKTEESATPVNGSIFDMKEQMVGNFEREYLISLLAENQFNISKAAAAAGCHRRTLYRMIHRHKIDLETIQEQRHAARATGRGHDEDEG